MATSATTVPGLDELAWLRRFAERLARDGDEADDLVQDTLVAAWQAPPRSTERSSRPWLATVARNAWRMRRRGAERRKRREQTVAAEPVPAAANPEDEHARVALLRGLLEDVERLDPVDEQIVVRRYFDGETAAEIGRALGMPAATVRSRLHRTHERLRAALDRRHGGRAAWAALALPRPEPLQPGASTVSLTHLFASVAIATTVGVAAWHAVDRDDGPADAPADADAPASTAHADASGSSAGADPSPRAETLARWDRRRAEIRRALETAPAEPPQDADLPAIDPLYDEFRASVAACLTDLESKASGAVTLSIREIGAPDVGTVYESVEVVTSTLDDDAVLDCLQHSMLALVGTAPTHPYARVVAKTFVVGEARDETAARQHMFDAVVGAHHGEIRCCEGEADAPVTGTVALAVAIGEEGQVDSVTTGPTALPEAVVECIATAARRWRFPAELAGRDLPYAVVLPVPGEPAGPRPQP